MDAFINFLIQYCLKKHFKSKRHMAREIGVGYRTVLHVTNEPEQYKGASLVFQELVLYCVGNGISVDEIAQAYYEKQGSNSPYIELLHESDESYNKSRFTIKRFLVTNNTEKTCKNNMYWLWKWMQTVLALAMAQGTASFNRFLKVLLAG